MMTNAAEIAQSSLETTRCPCCGRKTAVALPADYAPVYRYCDVCGEKFILERLAEGFQVMTLKDAPCCSDPDCREIEIGGGEEE